MRVLLINNYLYPRGGAERSLFRITDLLRAHGHEVIHYACRFDQNLPSPYQDYFPKDYQPAESPSPLAKLRALPRMIYNRPAAANLRRLLLKVQPDLAHLNNIYHHLTPSILPVLAERNIPTVLHLRDGKLVCPAIYMFCRKRFCDLCLTHRFWPAIRQRCYKGSFWLSTALVLESIAQEFLGFYRRHVDYYICPSQFLRRQIIRRGFDASGVLTLPNFVPALLLDALPQEQARVGDLPQRYLLCASRLTMDKGMFVLLEAARLVPEIPILIAGDGSARKQMSAFIDSHQIANVRLLGFQDEKSLAGLFRGAIASIMPSMLAENCPNVVLESAVQSCPVIASDVGGMEELVHDGVNGWLVSPDHPQNLSRAISQAFANPKRSAILGAAAKQRIIQYHNPDLFYRTLMQIYQKAQELHQ